MGQCPESNSLNIALQTPGGGVTAEDTWMHDRPPTRRHRAANYFSDLVSLTLTLRLRDSRYPCSLSTRLFSSTSWSIVAWAGAPEPGIPAPRAVRPPLSWFICTSRLP